MTTAHQVSPEVNVDRYEHTPPVGVRWHEYAEIFPWLEGAAREELKANIAKNGILEPIVFLDGAILDGRNRYEIARELGIEYPRVEYTGDDPLGFVIAKNLHRRHLSESQRAMVAKRLETMKHGGDRKSDQDANLHLDRAKAAALLNVSPRSVATAAKVLDHGAPELVKAVETGKVSVSAAAELVSLPQEEQAEVVAKGDDEAKRKAAELRQQKNAERKAQQAEWDRQREEARARLNPDIQRAEAAKARNGSVHAAVAKPSHVLSLEDRIAELEEANRVLEAENAELKAEVKKFSEMRAEWEKGGFEEVVRGKDEVIRAQASRIESESAEKVRNLRSMEWWRQKAFDLGYSNKAVIDLETGELVDG